MTDQSDKPKGRVITGPGQNIFKTASGGRSDYGGLIISALTGKSQEELVEQVAKRMKGEDAERLRKQLAEGGDVAATLLDAEDQFFTDYLRIGGGPSLIAPPIAPERLERLVAENSAVEPCIAAMVTNISGTKMQIMSADGMTEADLTEADKEERKGLYDFFNECAPRKSFLRVRKELRRDLHTTGNSYLVVERTATGDLAFVRRAPSKSMRIIKLDDPVSVTIKTRRAGKMVELTTIRAERRYVQKVGTKLVYYKEYGASRDLNRTTGEWAAPGALPANQRAHEVIHDKDIEDVTSPYGMPRWITQLPSVLGSRMAEEHNLAYFQSGGVPPVMVFITGGMVSEDVAKAINQYLTGGSKDKQRGVAVEVPSSGNLENERPAQVFVERFGSQDADSTFEVYLEKDEKRIRRAFRLPGIFLGMSENYNFATAHASYVVAEAQVFAPERDEEDERINMTLMRELDPEGKWRVVSNPLSVQDVNLQLKALQMLSAIKGVGVADIVKAISTIAGLEIEVHEDHQDDIVGVTGETGEGAGEGDQTGVAPDDDGANGQTPPPPQSGGKPPSPGVTSQVRNQAIVLAARMARTIREFDDLADDNDLSDLLELETTYDALSPGAQDIVNSALAPVLYNSPFLNDAAMSDVAAGYAKAAFHAARAKRKAAAPVLEAVE